MLHFVFLTFLPQKNHGVWCPERQAGIWIPGGSRGASHLPALFLLSAGPLPSIYSVFGTSCVAEKVKMGKQCALLGWRRRCSASQQRAALGRRVRWFPSRNLRCYQATGHGGLVSQIAGEEKASFAGFRKLSGSDKAGILSCGTPCCINKEKLIFKHWDCCQII